MQAMRTVLILAVVLAPAVVIAVMRNEGRRGRARVESAELRVEPLGLRRELPDGRTEAIDWDEIRVVEVVRASFGPHRHSGGVVLLGGEGERGCLVPLDRLADTNLTSHLRRLPGFDMARFDAAMARRAPSRTVVWGEAPPTGE